MAGEMKDSGVEWIGEIGIHFRVVKLKHVCTILDQFRKPVTADQRNQEGEILYDYYGASGIIDKINGYTIDDHVMLIGEDGANLKMRNLPIMYEVNGKAWINNHAHILKPKKGLDFYYLFFALEAIDITPYITGSAQPKLSQENMKNILLPVPNISIQKEIVRCIKSTCNELNNILVKTRASIEEYKKLKQAVITQAVTKGVRGDREMKDSGIEWIGYIPSTWIIKKAKYCVLLYNGSNPKTDGDIPVYGSGMDSFKTCGEFKEGPTVLIGRKGATLHIPHYITGKYWNVDTAFDTRVKSGFNLKYYYYLACSFDYKYYISQTTLPSMTQSNYVNMLLPCPDYDEQVHIVEYLDNKCNKIDELINDKQNQLDALGEYKKSLIYEYVTGKKEVPPPYKA